MIQTLVYMTDSSGARLGHLSTRYVTLPTCRAGRAGRAGWQVTRGTDTATLTGKTGLYSTMQAQDTHNVCLACWGIANIWRRPAPNPAELALQTSLIDFRRMTPAISGQHLVPPESVRR